MRPVVLRSDSTLKTHILILTILMRSVSREIFTVLCYCSLRSAIEQSVIHRVLANWVELVRWNVRKVFAKRFVREIEGEKERKRERIGRSWYRSLREIVRCTTELGTITYKVVVSFQDFPLPSLLYLRFSITPTPFDFFRLHPRILISFFFRITAVYSQHEFRPPALIQMISIGQSTIRLGMFSCVQILIDRTSYRFMQRRYIWE